MPSLVLGPMLRYVGETDAVIWVETDAACTVEVLGSEEPTFHVEGHHYGLLHVADLKPGAWNEYEVTLDGERAWPEPDSDFPPSVIRTYPRDEPLKIAFGSCRVALPHEEPYTLRKDENEEGREIDALYALARRMRSQPREDWPHLLLMLGDQVYADEVSPKTREFQESRRDTSESPWETIADFAEYARLYHEAWSYSTIRWLLSTISSAMIFDDHDIHDDWNISATWVDQMRSEDWWDEHIVGGLMSYWIYQHVGNLSPREQEQNDLLARIKDADDAGPVLREFALRADREEQGTRWSYHRDVGRTRIVVIDSRAGRVVEERKRSMVDEDEWDWITEHATGGFDHLLIATSLPFLLSPSMHYLEAWSEAVCGGAWGSAAAKVCEKVRQGVDLEHWSAFGASFARLAELQRSVAAGERGTAPASIITLSGDVHHAYLSEVAFRRGSGAGSPVYQAVCSPFRNPLGKRERLGILALRSRVAMVFLRALARSAGVPDPPIRWRLTHDKPWFNNQVATLEIDGRELQMRLEKTVSGDAEAVADEHREPRLECVVEGRLADGEAQPGRLTGAPTR